MKLHRLEIENFRGVRKMRIDLHPRLNVFAGKNGIGKTTILDALRKAIDIAPLDHISGNERRDLESGAIISPRDIRIGAERALIRLQFSLGEKRINTIVSSRPDEMSSDLISQFPGAGIQLPRGFFLEAYSMFPEDHAPRPTRFRTSFAWISEREALENNRLRKFIDSGKKFGEDPFEKDESLQAVKNIIADITGFVGLFDDKEKQGFTVRKSLGDGEEVFLFSQLSSGERRLVAFVAEIAVFLAINFPKKKNPLHGAATFMVDDIELHLHPSWQRKIIPRLLAAFPNCQFFVSTHSPQVVGNVRAESVFILKRMGDDITCEHPDESLGMTIDRLLELVMEDVSRPAESMREKLEVLFERISRKEFDKARGIARLLKNEIPTDPDLIRAEMLLHGKGLIP